MNKASLTPAVVRILTLTTIPPLTYLGVTQYNELNKIELPELPIVQEPEPEPKIVESSEPQIKTRKVWKQIKGVPLTSWFSSSYTTYNYSAKALDSYCKSDKVYGVMKNWCKQAEFSEVEEEIKP